MCLMLPNDNESKVLIDVDQFIQSVYKTELNKTLFKSILNDLVPKFKAVYKAHLKYSESVCIFKRMVYSLDEILLGHKSIDELSNFELRFLWNNALIYFNDVNLELLGFKSQEKRNRNGLEEYLIQLTKHYSKLLFIRIDLSIALDHQHEVGIEQFNHYLRIFINRVQNQDTCFKDLQGYAWAIEQGEKKGYHCHVLLIYDGHKHQNDFGIALQVGQCWKQITENKGYFFTSNSTEYKNKFDQKGMLGIGMIYRKNPQQVQNAINAAMYLVNPEKDNQYLRVKTLRMRSFGKGQYEIDKRRTCLK
ncbi:YagK/YfjJ domain-containing protein [Acinetobacter sp. WCHAc010052]|uniref:YagK/YfjJ domain-containing protein n=1 Tax=Acinetobacter sp. WCHAc010052 TaxID=2004647 RepID=UPI000B3CC113|nr:inovirus-type Gp2 protein [Acinetobacter sp. WCHAc010052]AXY61160.1 inovirus Gp2 family protein [Acinetobacter sp. WCHAc010052]